MQPLITIITVTYNAENTLTPTMESVNAQTYTDFQHLIMDGASSDRTLETAKRLATDRTEIFSEPDSGIYDAMNKGMTHARGQYLIFLNAGDSFHSTDTLGLIARTIESNGYPGIVYGQTQIVDSGRRYVADRHLKAPEKLTYESFADGMLVCHQAFIALARIAPLYDTRYRFSADYDWCIQCLQHSRKNVYIPETLIDYLNEGTTTANHRKSLIERFRIMRYYYGTTKTISKHIMFLPRYINRKNKS